MWLWRKTAVGAFRVQYQRWHDTIRVSCRVKGTCHWRAFHLCKIVPANNRLQLAVFHTPVQYKNQLLMPLLRSASVALPRDKLTPSSNLRPRPLPPPSLRRLRRACAAPRVLLGSSCRGVRAFAWPLAVTVFRPRRTLPKLGERAVVLRTYPSGALRAQF